MRTASAAAALAATLLASLVAQGQANKEVKVHVEADKKDRFFQSVDHFEVRRLDEDRIHVDVRASDHVFVSHELTRVRNLYAKSSSIRMGGADGQEVVLKGHRHAKFTYQGDHEYGWFTCSYHPEKNRMHLIVRNGTKSVEVGQRQRFLKDLHGRDLATLPESDFWLEVSSVDDTLLHADAAPEHGAAARNLDSSDDGVEAFGAEGCAEREVPDDIAVKSADLEDLELLPGDDTSTIDVFKNSNYSISTIKRTKKSVLVPTANLTRLQGAGRRLADAYAFTPDCYTGDERLHELLVNLVSDTAFYNDLGDDTDAVQEKYEEVVAAASQIYQIQMNVKLAINNVWMGTDSNPSSFPALASYTDDSGCPGDFNTQLNTVTAWTRKIDDADQAVHLHLFTGCSSGSSTIGIAWIGTLCNFNYNTGMSKYSSTLWRTFAHELGHGFGAQHSFENGMYTTGGIMDYGNGKILGTNLYRFRLARRDEMCGELEDVVSSECAFINVYDDGEGCGNGLITDDEECECVDGSTSCTGCKNCMLTDDTVECSTSKFYMVIAGSSSSYGSLADSQCCQNNKLVTAGTECDDGYCGAGGLCSDPCNSVSSSLTACGAINNGCRIKCTDGSTCSAYWRSSGSYIGIANEGTMCTTDSGAKGECGDGTGTCTYVGPPTKKPTPAPTPPTPFPTAFPTNFPTPSPTPAPTSFPTKFPSTAPTSAPSATKGISFPSKKLCKFKKNCKITESGLARFGNNDEYAFYAFEDITSTTKFKCNEDTFGFDPLPNTKKKFCWFSPTTFSFSKLANDGRKGTVSKAGIVRYGANDKYVFKTYDSKTSIKCEAAEFAADPAPNSSSKKCYVSYF